MHGAKTPLRILFVIRAVEQLPYYESIIGSLAGRGHELRLLFDKRWSKDQSHEELDELQKRFPSLEWAWAMRQKQSIARNILFYTREILTYRQYLLLHQEGESRYYDRWVGYLPKNVQRLMKYAFVKRILKSELSGAVLRICERIIRPDHAASKAIREYRPDVVIAGPANLRFSSADFEYLKAAVRLNLPTAVPVSSWDNLTTKGLIHVKPDILLAWNNKQADEAQAVHGIAKESIRVVGAAFFDRWFDTKRTPRARVEFCRDHGLSLANPILLYLGSSVTVAPNEVWLVKELRRALDNDRDGALRHVQIIVRPHPINASHFAHISGDGIFVVPKGDHHPARKGVLDLFGDTLAHSVAVVGINTSGMIDALIADKPVIALMVDEYRSTQSVAQHFQYVLESGALEKAKGVNACVSAIGKLLKGLDAHQQERQKFVREFVRPRGLSVSAGDAAAEEIIKLCNAV